MQDGATPFSIAARKGHLEVVKFVCDARADKDKSMQHGATLREAVADKDESMQHGA